MSYAYFKLNVAQLTSDRLRLCQILSEPLGISTFRDHVVCTMQRLI